MTSIDCDEQERVNAAFTWTVEEFKAAHKDYSAARTRIISGKVFWILFFIASTLYALLVYLEKGFSIETGGYGISLLVLGGILIGVSILCSPWYQARQFIRYRAALCGKTVKWEITPTELVNSLSDGTGAKLHWNSITSASKGTRGILLYITPKLFHWLPYHAFTSSEDVNRFEKLVEKHIKYFRRTDSIFPQVVSGFLIAPFFAPLPIFFYSLQNEHLPLLTLIMQTIMASLPIAYLVAVLFGIPLFLLLRKMSCFNLASTLLGGVTLGLLPLFLLAPKAIPRIVAEGKIFYPCVLGMGGMISALVFWMIVGWKRGQAAFYAKNK